MKRKKWMIYFVITLVATLLIGTAGLLVYARFFAPGSAHADAEEAMQFEERMQSGEEAAADGAMQELPVIETDLEIHAGLNAGEDVGVGSQAETDSDAGVRTDAKTQIADTETDATATLTFGGDICFHDPYANMASLSMRGGTIDTCIDSRLLGEMQQSDLCMVNNEFPYSDRGTPCPGKTYTFRSKPENVALLAQMGVDIVSLANNHAYDYGADALCDTLSVLDDAEIMHVGAGRNIEEASAPVYVEINKVKIGVVAATQIERLDTPDTKGATKTAPGVMRCYSQGELDRLLQVITEAKKQCDVLVVYIHWGTENTDVLDWAQPYQADLIAKAGADLIVGAHPHCLQGLDMIDGVPVIYSLGNYWFNSKPLDSGLLKVTVNKEGVESVRILPARQENCYTSLLEDAQKQRVLDYLQGLSPNVTIDAEGFVK